MENYFKSFGVFDRNLVMHLLQKCNTFPTFTRCTFHFMCMWSNFLSERLLIVFFGNEMWYIYYLMFNVLIEPSLNLIRWSWNVKHVLSNFKRKMSLNRLLEVLELQASSNFLPLSKYIRTCSLLTQFWICKQHTIS